MSLAAATREAVRERPFLYDALRAGVVNYTAAARLLDVEGDTDAVATALRRFAEEMPERPGTGTDVRVTMQSRVGPSDDPAEPLLSVGDTALAADGGDATAVMATGSVSPPLLRRVLGRLETADIAVEAAGVGGSALVVVVPRRDGPDTLRAVERLVE